MKVVFMTNGQHDGVMHVREEIRSILAEWDTSLDTGDALALLVQIRDLLDGLAL